MEPIAILIAGGLASAVAYRLVSVTPLGQASVEVIFVRMQTVVPGAMVARINGLRVVC